MATLKEILDCARYSINETVQHYFTNVAAGQEKAAEIQFLAELLLQQQPWLFFTGDALENTQNQIMKSSLNINLIYNLTMLFRSRFHLGDDDYSKLLDHIANSSNTKECSDEHMSFMVPEYRNRVLPPAEMLSLMKNNRSLVFLFCMVLYLETDLLTKGLK